MKDRGFCSPIIDEAEVAAKKKKEEMDREIELIQKEYEEKLKKNQSKNKDTKEKEKGKDKGKEDEKKAENEEDKAEKEKSDKVTCWSCIQPIFREIDCWLQDQSGHSATSCSSHGCNTSYLRTSKVSSSNPCVSNSL